MPEFRYDLIQEKVISKISANYFLSVLEGRIPHQEISQLPKGVVGFHELPNQMQSSFLNVEADYKKRTEKLSRSTSMLYGAFWSYEKAVGFSEQKPDRDKTNPWRDINLSNRIK